MYQMKVQSVSGFKNLKNCCQPIRAGTWMDGKGWRRDSGADLRIILVCTR
jgi:hypothetical protein